MENINIDEYIKDLSPELQEKAKACSSVNELLELARENKVPLPDDALEAVAGGKDDDTGFKPTDKFHIFREDVGARFENNEIAYLYTVQLINKPRAWYKFYLYDCCREAGCGGADLGLNKDTMIKLMLDPRANSYSGYYILRNQI